MLSTGPKLLRRLDRTIHRLMQRYGITLLRWSLAVVFLWFGALKIFNVSPVYDLVAETVSFMPPHWFVPFLGFWEVLVGLGLLFRIALRLTLLFFWIQMAGTFSVLIVHPDLSFQQDNALLLTTMGEFVIKNLVFIAGGLVIGSTVRRDEHPPVPHRHQPTAFHQDQREPSGA